MAYRKFKPTVAQIEAWQQQCDNFKDEIIKLEKKYNVIITINNSCNSIYFKSGDKDIRISTHHSQLAEMTGINGSGYKLPPINLVTNSRENILKLAEKQLNI